MVRKYKTPQLHRSLKLLAWRWLAEKLYLPLPKLAGVNLIGKRVSIYEKVYTGPDPGDEEYNWIMDGIVLEYSLAEHSYFVCRDSGEYRYSFWTSPYIHQVIDKLHSIRSSKI